MLQYKILHIPTGNFVEKVGECSWEKDLTFFFKFTTWFALMWRFRKKTFVLTYEFNKRDKWEQLGREQFCIVAINKKLRIPIK